MVKYEMCQYFELLVELPGAAGHNNGLLSLFSDIILIYC